jgi:hypothetical protein
MNKTTLFKASLPVIGMLLLTIPMTGQIVVSAGDTYSQNFDTSGSSADDTLITNTGTANPAAWTWTNNSTYSGWYRQVKVGSTLNKLDKNFIGEFKDGTVRFGSMGNGGTWDTANTPAPRTDRALGSLIQGAGNEVSFGAVFQVSGASLGGMDISYSGEQWFRTPNPNTLQFQYKVLSVWDATNFAINEETNWVDVDSLDFSALVVGTNLKRNGNFDTEALSATINLTATDGQYIAIRWQAIDTAGGATQSGLGIDDLSVAFTAVPEPSTYALLLGIIVLGLGYYRSRS